MSSSASSTNVRAQDLKQGSQAKAPRKLKGKERKVPSLQEGQDDDFEEVVQGDGVQSMDGQPVPFPRGESKFTLTPAEDYPAGGHAAFLRRDLRPVCLAGWSHGDHGVRPIWNVGHRFPVQFHFKPTRPIPADVEHLQRADRQVSNVNFLLTRET